MPPEQPLPPPHRLKAGGHSDVGNLQPEHPSKIGYSVAARALPSRLQDPSHKRFGLVSVEPPPSLLLDRREAGQHGVHVYHGMPVRAHDRTLVRATRGAPDRHLVLRFGLWRPWPSNFGFWSGSC